MSLPEAVSHLADDGCLLSVACLSNVWCEDDDDDAVSRFLCVSWILVYFVKRKVFVAPSNAYYVIILSRERLYQKTLF